MAKLTGLGKGLDALLSASKINLDVDSAAKTSNDVTELVNQLSDISLNKIQPGKYQPRKVFDEVELQE
ncbi:MAG: chromosome partitioning protein ParB, partial [Neisseriales bacterium]